MNSIEVQDNSRQNWREIISLANYLSISGPMRNSQEITAIAPALGSFFNLEILLGEFQ